MALQIVTNMETLMLYAKALGRAKRSGDTKWIAEAQKRHDEYLALVKRSDKVLMPFRWGELP